MRPIIRNNLSAILGAGILLFFLMEFVTPDSALSAAQLPELPRIYIDTSFPAQTGRVVAVRAGEDLQAALDTARCGDTFVLEAGATFTGGYHLKNVGECNGNWIVLKSSRMDQLPAQGTRVKPSDSVNMPKIVSPNNEPAIQTINDANYYWLAGLEVTTTYMAPNIIFSLVYFGTPTENLAHHIVVDRCYVHGNPDQYVNSGVGMAGSYMAVVDSYVSRIHDLPFESQAVYVCKGPGPYKVVNNYLEATGENFFSGDCGKIPGVIESDIELRYNYIYKPTSWYTEAPDYAGTKWCVKNSIEFKNGQRALIEGNVIEHNYPQGQVGWAIVLSPRKNGTPYVNDITFRNNIVRHVPNGINILGRDDGDPHNPDLIGTTQANRILIQNNLFDGVDGTLWGGSGGSWGALYQLSGSDITIDHNTGFQAPIATGGIGWVYATYEGVKTERFTFTNNLHNYNRGGLTVDGIGSGFPALHNVLADNYQIEKNVLVATVNKYVFPECYTCDSEYYASFYPANNYFPLTAGEIGMTNYNNGVDGNYTLLPSSPYKGLGTDGKDIGADISAVLFATRGTVTGVWDKIVNISPTSQSFGAAGGAGSIRVTALTQGGWRAESNVDWVSITAGTPGSGDGEVTYAVSANTTTLSRSGILTIGSETFEVNQEAFDPNRPSVPTGLGAVVVSSSQINLAWSDSTDNVAVTGYRIYRNGKEVATATGTAYEDIGLRPKTVYRYQVAAYDAAGNISLKSKSVSKTTQPLLSTKFSGGDRVQTTGKVPVRFTPSGKGAIAGTQAKGALGTVIGGPSYANGQWWWQVDFENNSDGWVLGTRLKK